MQQMRFELTNLSRQLDWIINHAIDRSEKHGDQYDLIADDATDARENVMAAIKVATKEIV